MKLRVKNDIECIFKDYNDEFDHSKMIIKKDTIIKVNKSESKVKSLPGSKYENCYFITFSPYEYDENEVKIEILKESEEDENDVNELRNIDCGIEIDVDDVEEI